MYVTYVKYVNLVVWLGLGTQKQPTWLGPGKFGLK